MYKPFIYYYSVKKIKGIIPFRFFIPDCAADACEDTKHFFNIKPTFIITPLNFCVDEIQTYLQSIDISSYKNAFLLILNQSEIDM